MRTAHLGLLGLLGLIVSACGGGGGSSPTSPPPPSPAPTCLSVAGTWTARWEMPPCGDAARGQSPITIAQTGCAVGFTVPGLGRFDGTLVGDRSSPVLTLRFDAAAPGAGGSCTPTGSAGLTVVAAGADVAFGGAPSPCCQHGSMLLRR